MALIRHEDLLRAHVDFVGSSERWVVQKPDPGFFAYVVEEAGVPAVRIRRGAHADVESPDDSLTIDSLAQLPEALAHV